MFDYGLFQFIHGFANQSAFVDWFFVFIAEYLPYVMVLVSFVLFAKVPAWKQKLRVFIVTAFALVISRGLIFEIIRYVYERPRPFLALGFEPLFQEPSFAFPSSHAIILTVFALMTISVSRKWGYAFLLFVFINGFARVYSGVHWPTDILGGICIAAISVFIAARVFPRNQFEPSLEQAPVKSEEIAE